jgi:hypothetical protein
MEMSGQLHAPGKRPQYQLNRRLGGPQSRSGRGGEKIICGCKESISNLPAVQLSSSPLFQFLNTTQTVGHLGRRMSPSQGRYLHTRQHKYRINTHRHTCLEWDSNPRSYCSSEGRHFVPYTAGLLWSVLNSIYYPCKPVNPKFPQKQVDWCRGKAIYIDLYSNL